ncbi:hypothetical protein T439DRAFT_355695 [Meredithblackwellia eburnea MCA 4105]
MKSQSRLNRHTSTNSKATTAILERAEMLDEEADFDFGSWCPVCDRAIPSSAVTSTAQGSANGSGAHTPELPDGAAPSTSASVKGKEKQRKKDHGGVGVAQGGGGGGAATGTHGPGHLQHHQRRKSSTKLHHASSRHHHHHSSHHHSKSHSNSSANLQALTSTNKTPPLTPAAEGAGASKDTLNPPTSLYCSEECRRIDEMRSRLAFADLGPSAPRASSANARRPSSSTGGDPSAPSPSAGVGEAEELMASMSRRRSSGTSLASMGVISPSLHAQQQWPSSSSLTSHSQTSSSHVQHPHPHPIHHVHNSLHNHVSHQPHSNSHSHSHSHQSHSSESHPTLNFSTRRNSRSSISAEGGYSYRPSLMQRVPSSDDGLPATGDERRSSTGWSRSRGSSDSLASMGEADERSERAFSVRPPSALSALRFMTPISTSTSSSPPVGRPKRPAALSRHNTDAPKPTAYRVDTVSEEGGKGKERAVTTPPLSSPKMLEKRSESDPGNLLHVEEEEVPDLPPVGSISMRPPTEMARSASTVRKPSRTASSASLALMGTSLGKSFVPRSMERSGWGAPKRSESTASLSSMVAQGNILPVSTITAPTPPETSAASSRRNSMAPRLSTSPSSPSSNSSFPRSHSSTRSSQRSTAESSDHPDHRTSVKGGSEYGGNNYSYSQRQASSSSLAPSSKSPHTDAYLSSSAGSQAGGAQPSSRGPGNRNRRSNQGLIMTPSASSLSGASSTNGDEETARLPPGSRERRESWQSERTPTQSLSKAASVQGNGGSHVSLAELDPETTPLAAKRAVGPKTARAMSNSATRRPLHAELTGALVANSPPVNAAGVNPSLSYLYPNGAPSATVLNGGGVNVPVSSSPPTMLAANSRNWSWDHLPVPTYTALDVDKVRRDRGVGVTDVNSGAGMPGAAKERKRLFYFSDVE